MRSAGRQQKASGQGSLAFASIQPTGSDGQLTQGIPCAHVAVSAATYVIDKPYVYRLPSELTAAAVPGMRCMVPFSQGNRLVEGILLDCFQGVTCKGLKAVHSLLDEEPVLKLDGLRLALWMRERYFCTVYAAVKAMLPAGLFYTAREEYSLASGVTEAALEELRGASAQYRLLRFLLDRGGSASRAQLLQSRQFSAQALRGLEEKGLIRRSTTLTRNVGDKTEQIAMLSCPAADVLAKLGKGAKAQRAVVELLDQVGSASVKDLCYFTGVTRQPVLALEKKGFVILFQREVYRRASGGGAVREAPPVLNREQNAAYESVCALLEERRSACALLYGVTGSGKTQVYIRLIHKIIAQGRRALVLVPEIALTPQLLKHFEAQFGENVAILHSSLGAGERYDEWKRARDGRASVVVGTRSAVFAPLDNLGLIVLDEEQEASYQSEQSPRYHARDVAKYRCAHSGAVLLLGSATPSVESMYQARQGIYKLLHLRERYNRQAMPAVQIVDMRDELRAGNASCLSVPLCRELEQNLQRGEQAVLFLNRRGTSRMAVCVSCGETPECPNCSVKLTYHRDNDRLMCHHCGFSRRMEPVCPSCGGGLSLVDAGVQMVQEQLENRFPGVGILRMDADSVSASNRHEDILRRFEQERIPILLGTQMVAKGLDFENVTLVGALDADQGLYVDSYRAGERVFSLLTQVVGRAGRGSRSGRAIIQTFTPKNDIILCAARQDYDAFYEGEIQLRQARQTPPIRDLYQLTLSGVIEPQVVNAARRLAGAMEQWQGSASMSEEPFRFYGPAQAPVLRIMGRYRYRLTVVCKNTKKMREMLAFLLRTFQKDPENKGVSVAVELNPMQ